MLLAALQQAVPLPEREQPAAVRRSRLSQAEQWARAVQPPVLAPAWELRRPSAAVQLARLRAQQVWRRAQVPRLLLEREVRPALQLAVSLRLSPAERAVQPQEAAPQGQVGLRQVLLV